MIFDDIYNVFEGFSNFAKISIFIDSGSISGGILVPFWEVLEAWGRQNGAKSAKKEGREKV